MSSPEVKTATEGYIGTVGISRFRKVQPQLQANSISPEVAPNVCLASGSDPAVCLRLPA